MPEDIKYAPDVERRLVKDVPGTKIGQLRLSWTWADDNGRFTVHFDVKDVDEAKNLVKRLAAEQVNDDSIEFNVHGLDEWRDFGEGMQWYDFNDDHGDTLDELMENEIDPDGPLIPPPVKYRPRGPHFGEWRYTMNVRELKELYDEDDEREFDLAMASKLQAFIAEHPELKNDITLNWLVAKFFALGSSEGMNPYELSERSMDVLTRLYRWADDDKRCWINS